MADLRHRTKDANKEDTAGEGAQPTNDGEDEVTDLPGVHFEAQNLPQASDSTTEAIDSAIKDFSPRVRNYIIRGMFSMVMMIGFCFLIYLGPLALVLLVMGIQFYCFTEIINIGYCVYKSQDLPWFRTLSWYWLAASNYFLYGESMIDYFGILLNRTEFMQVFVTYHRFISFALYLMGFVGFVMSLVKKHYLQQFTLFGWTHVTLLIVIVQSQFIVRNIFEGPIWFFMSTSLIICNDIWAYIFGFFFGKTPLIKLSPKKTWEGFIGGAFATIIFGFISTSFLVQSDFFVCPVTFEGECSRHSVFLVAEYNLPRLIITLFKMVGIQRTTIHMVPFVLQSFWFSLFASILGPFGGFFASGFKRAFKIKDFGDTIPGHGGLMDRFDCQLLMGVFTHIYINTFIKTNPIRLMNAVLALRPEEQVEFFHSLQEKLINSGLLTG